MRSGHAKRFIVTIQEKWDLLIYKASLLDANSKIIGVYGIDHFLGLCDNKIELKLLNIEVPSSQLKKHTTNDYYGLSSQQLKCLHLLVKGMTAKKSPSI